MEIDKKLLEHVVEVARLKLTEEEIKEFLPQLKDILESFSEIKKVKTKDVKESFHPVSLKDALREDIPSECLTQEEALKNVRDKKDGYIKGPKVI